MYSIRGVVASVMGVLCCSLVTGCSYLYTFDVSGVVNSGKTGKPIPGVKIYSMSHALPDNETPEERTTYKVIATTGDDGTFSFEEQQSGASVSESHDAKWVLFFSKDGFKGQNVDLKTVRAPASAKTKSTVCVVVYLLEE
jgi:hypothetical protein